MATKAYTVQDIGTLVRQRRRELGLTQRDLADSCGCGVRFVSDLERGKPTVEAGKLLQLVNTLSMDVSLERRG